jgi:DNA-binding transcriptional regulator YiaG
MKFNQQIAAIRAKLGMSQQELAGELQIAVSTVSKWERGESTPSGYARAGIFARLSNIKPKQITK